MDWLNPLIMAKPSIIDEPIPMVFHVLLPIPAVYQFVNPSG
jgi:hypothetical protein